MNEARWPAMKWRRTLADEVSIEIAAISTPGFGRWARTSSSGTCRRRARCKRSCLADCNTGQVHVAYAVPAVLRSVGCSEPGLAQIKRQDAWNSRSSRCRRRSRRRSTRRKVTSISLLCGWAKVLLAMSMEQQRRAWRCGAVVHQARLRLVCHRR